MEKTFLRWIAFFLSESERKTRKDKRVQANNTF